MPNPRHFHSPTPGTADATPEPSPSDFFQPLLVSRVQAARLLGHVSLATLIRLEHAGKLTPIKLSGPASKTFYRFEDLKAVAEGRRS